jgi:hypothetical protein
MEESQWRRVNGGKGQRRKVLFINELTVSLHWLSSLPLKRLPSILAACRTFPE